MKDRKKILKIAFEHFTQNGCLKTSRTSLISPSFTDTYNPSGGHDKVTKLITEPNSLSDNHKEVFIDLCFRHIDLPRVGFGLHSSLFEMFTFIDADNCSNMNHYDVLKVSLEFICNKLCFDKDNLYFTVFNGEKIGNKFFEKDSETEEVLLMLGVNKSNICLLSGMKNFVFTKNNGDAAGPRTEIFYKDNQLIYPLEIGTIVFENYFFHNGLIQKSNNRVFGGAFGVERLLMATNHCNIDNIPHNKLLFENFIKKLEISSNIYSHPCYKEEVDRLIDSAKAIIFICLDGGALSKKGRGQRLKQLLKILRKSCSSINVEAEKALKLLIPEIQNIYSLTYPELLECENDCEEIIFNKMNLHR